jgi:DNA replication protein DnaC
MATWLAAQRTAAGKGPGRYVKCADLIGKIKATWKDGGKSIDTENDIIRRYRETRFLVIDEFHERGSSDWESRCLTNLLDHRYDEMLATIIIANLSPEKAALEINPSILSRAQQTGGMVICDWSSYRGNVSRQGRREEMI